MVYKYEYVCPSTKGYVLTSITKKQLKSVHKNYNYRVADSICVWYNSEHDDFIVEKFTAPWAIAVNWMMLPFTLLIYGLSNYKEIWKYHVYLLNERKHGRFVSDFIRGNSAEKLKAYLK